MNKRKAELISIIKQSQKELAEIEQDEIKKVKSMLPKELKMIPRFQEKKDFTNSLIAEKIIHVYKDLKVKYVKINCSEAELCKEDRTSTPLTMELIQAEGENIFVRYKIKGDGGWHESSHFLTYYVGEEKIFEITNDGYRKNISLCVEKEQLDQSQSQCMH